MSVSQATNPPSEQQGSMEDLVWEFDCSLLATAPINVTVVLQTGRNWAGNVPLVDGPQIIGTAFFQRVRAGVLTAGAQYRLLATYQLNDGSTNIYAAATILVCDI